MHLKVTHIRVLSIIFRYTYTSTFDHIQVHIYEYFRSYSVTHIRVISIIFRHTYTFEQKQLRIYLWSYLVTHMLSIIFSLRYTYFEQKQSHTYSRSKLSYRVFHNIRYRFAVINSTKYLNESHLAIGDIIKFYLITSAGLFQMPNSMSHLRKRFRFTICSRWRHLCCKTTYRRFLGLLITYVHVSVEYFYFHVWLLPSTLL